MSSNNYYADFLEELNSAKFQALRPAQERVLNQSQGEMRRTWGKFAESLGCFQCRLGGVGDGREGDKAVSGTMADGSQGFASADDSGSHAPRAGAVVCHLAAGPRLDVIGDGLGPGAGSSHHRTMGVSAFGRGGPVQRQLLLPVPSIILAGSPPVSDCAAGPLRCGSWARRIPG